MLSHLDPFRRRSVALALYRMLTGDRFDLCVVREALDASGREPRRDQLAALRLHHCARYHALPPGFHADLARETLALFLDHDLLSRAAGGPDAALDDLAAMAGLDPASTPSIPSHAPAAQA